MNPNLDTYESARGHRVYAIFLLPDAEGDVRFKIGKSSSLAQRVRDIQSMMPERIAVVQVVAAISAETALRTEKRLHVRFAHRRIHGEWFLMNLNDPEQKREWKDGCQSVFELALGPGVSWDAMDAADLEGEAMQRRIVANRCDESLDDQDVRKKAEWDKTLRETRVAYDRQLEKIRHRTKGFWNPQNAA